MMERLLEIASLCCARGFLPPKTVCMMRCCCSELRRTRVAWDAYEPLIEIDLSCPSAVGWLWQNITSNRALSLTNIPPAEQMLKLLLDDGRALTSLQIKDPHIKSLPSLPAKLEGLCVSGCSMLCSLPDLPASMELLQCEDCRSLTVSLSCAKQQQYGRWCGIASSSLDLIDPSNHFKKYQVTCGVNEKSGEIAQNQLTPHVALVYTHQHMCHSSATFALRDGLSVSQHAATTCCHACPFFAWP